MVGVIVAALMDHQRQALDVTQALQARRQYRLAGLAVAVDVERWQVAHVAITPGLAMLAGVLRIPVAGGGTGGSRLAVYLGRLAAAFGVDMKAVQAGLQPGQLGAKHRPYSLLSIFTLPTDSPIPWAVTALTLTLRVSAWAARAVQPASAAMIHCFI